MFPKGLPIHEINAFWDQLKAGMERCGIGYRDPEPYFGYSLWLPGTSDDDNNDNAIGKVIERAQQDGVKILLVILDTNLAAVRARVKSWGDSIYGMSERRQRSAVMLTINIRSTHNLRSSQKA